MFIISVVHDDEHFFKTNWDIMIIQLPAPAILFSIFTQLSVHVAAMSSLNLNATQTENTVYTRPGIVQVSTFIL